MSQEAHISETPTYIGFGDYTTHIPGNIPVAVQQATDRFLGTRAARVAEKANWEALRQAAHEIRLHTLLHLDSYLEQVERQVTEAGGHVHWARDAAEARAKVIDIARQHNVKTAVKVKSMATEEIGLNHALEAAGIQAYETDLGEFIIQLAGVGPSHIIVPAVHLKKEVAAFFAKLARRSTALPPGCDRPCNLRERFRQRRWVFQEPIFWLLKPVPGDSYK
jgi:L-lactate dehydrogenase complex protein LldF